MCMSKIARFKQQFRLTIQSQMFLKNAVVATSQFHLATHLFIYLIYGLPYPWLLGAQGNLQQIYSDFPSLAVLTTEMSEHGGRRREAKVGGGGSGWKLKWLGRCRSPDGGGSSGKPDLKGESTGRWRLIRQRDLCCAKDDENWLCRPTKSNEVSYLGMERWKMKATISGQHRLQNPACVLFCKAASLENCTFFAQSTRQGLRH